MDLNIKNLLLQSRRPTNKEKMWGYKSQLPLLTLLHFSDIHGDGAAMERLCDFKEEYAEYIDDCLCTGDIAAANFFSDFDFWHQNGRSKDVLSCIGNHDVLGDTGWDWTKRISQKECYERFYAPYIENWGCVYRENKTYYYKDYPENAVRLIVLDSILTDEDEAEQLQWLENVLNDAIENNLHVMIGMHYPVRMEKINCNFSTLDKGDLFGVETMDVYMEKVQAFMDNGGDFIVWLTGHGHIDYVGCGQKYPNQLCIAIDSACRHQSDAYNDFARIDGMPSQDLYNMVTVDTFCHLLKIVRIGADVDRFLRKRDTLCINYKTLEVIK
jgi:hypothetical protein